jgi:hypothetical protein
MKRHLPFALIFAAIIFCGCISTYGQSREIESLVKKLTVSKKTFLTITNGSSLDAVTNILGFAARHEFTVSEKKTNYTLIDCRECPNGNVDDDNDIYLLFRDNILVKMMRPVSFPELRETYKYSLTAATRAKPWDIGETPRLVRKTINAPALTQSEMVDYLKPYDGKGMEQPNIAEDIMFAGVVALAGPVGWSNMHKDEKELKNDYETNEMFLKLYDGCRASLGMSLEKVDALYGKPLRVLPMKNRQTARIYGDSREFENFNPGEQFSCVAVVFNPRGNVTAIYSDGYFCDDWKK